LTYPADITWLFRCQLRYAVPCVPARSATLRYTVAVLLPIPLPTRFHTLRVCWLVGSYLQQLHTLTASATVIPATIHYRLDYNTIAWICRCATVVTLIVYYLPAPGLVYLRLPVYPYALRLRLVPTPVRHYVRTWLPATAALRCYLIAVADPYPDNLRDCILPVWFAFFYLPPLARALPLLPGGTLLVWYVWLPPSYVTYRLDAWTPLPTWLYRLTVLVLHLPVYRVDLFVRTALVYYHGCRHCGSITACRAPVTRLWIGLPPYLPTPTRSLFDCLPPCAWTFRAACALPVVSTGYPGFAAAAAAVTGSPCLRCCVTHAAATHLGFCYRFWFVTWFDSTMQVAFTAGYPAVAGMRFAARCPFIVYCRALRFATRAYTAGAGLRAPTHLAYAVYCLHAHTTV